MKTINQLLDKMDRLPVDSMQPLGTIRQNLIDTKRQHPKGGLIVPDNSQQIDDIINDARAQNRKQITETAVAY